MNQLEPDHQDLRTRAARILHAMADTPIPAMDATYYAHYAEELRMIVEELLAQPHPVNASVTRVWLLWNCHDIAGSFPTEHAAIKARATLQRHLLNQHGPDTALLASITITTADIPTNCLGPQWGHQ